MSDGDLHSWHRLEEIRARLGNATPGPWETVPTVGNAVIAPDADGGYWTDVADRIETEPDAAFIANAPADIAWLLAEVEGLREQVADAWDLGVRAGWAMSGEGWNAEYPGDIDPLDELNYPNPYREETT